MSEVVSRLNALYETSMEPRKTPYQDDSDIYSAHLGLQFVAGKCSIQETVGLLQDSISGRNLPRVIRLVDWDGHILHLQATAMYRR